MDSFLNTNGIVPETIDVAGLNKVYDDWHKSFVESFKGMPIKVDESLEGGQYYIAVSRELFEDLKVQSSSSVPLQAPESPVRT